MNKRYRDEILKLLGLMDEEPTQFKHQGKPCYCCICSHKKFSRKVKHVKTDKELW